MKIYIDFDKLQITKIVQDVMYKGDVLSNAFELLFYNCSDTSWYPTMSQLAPNDRQAGDFAADALEEGESQTVIEDDITYLRYKFTIGAGWVLVKGKSEFFIWKNTVTPMTRKCIGKVVVTLNESTETYFIDDVEFNPKIRTYINGLASDIEDELNDKVDAQNATIASLSQASPSVFDTAANIQLLQENKGVAVATDTGYIWYWDTTITPNAYVSSGLQYNGLYYKNLTDVDVTVRNDTFNDGYVETNDYTIIEATLSASLLTAITTSNYSFGCDMALLASDLGITLPTTEKTFYTKVSDSTGSFLFTDISSTSFNARVIKYSATDYEQTINLTFIHPTQNIGLVSFDPDHYFVLFEKTTAPAIVEINNDDIAYTGSYVEVWLKLTGVKLQGLLNITPKIYLASDEEKTNLLNIPDTADTYNSNNTLVECQNGTLSVFSLASMLGKATLSDIFVLIDRVDISNWSNANHTFETTITTPTSSSSFKLEGYGEIIYKYGENLEGTYKAIVNVPAEIHTINAIDTATMALSNESQTQMIKGEAVQQISKRNIILRAGKDLNLLNIDYGESEVLFYPQMKLTNMSLFVEYDEAYLFKTRLSFFEYGRDVYIFLIKMLVDGSEFYRFQLSYTPDIVSIYFNDGKLLKNNGDMEQTIFNCSTEPMEADTNPITSDAVYTALEAKQDVLTFDNAPTQNSNNPVKSGGVYDAIKQAIADFKWELGTHTIDSETDSDVKYQKIAPVGTFGCEIDKLGGMSYKSENYYPLNEFSNDTKLGITLTNNDNGTLKINGTAAGYPQFYMGNITLNAGTYYLPDETLPGVFLWVGTGLDNDNDKRSLVNKQASMMQSFTLTETTVCYFTLVFVSGAQFTNTIFYPLCVKDKSNVTISDYTPYFTGIRNSAVTNLTIGSANLLQINDVASTTTNGVTYKVENGVITFSGVASANFNIALTINLSLSSGSYTHCQMETFPSGLSSNLGISGSAIDGNNQSFNYSRTFSVASDTTSTTMYFVFVSGTNVNGLTLRPMAVKGTTAPTEFLPYQAPTTKAIPQAIRNLTGYGWGINDTCYNYIDFERKVFIQKVGRVKISDLSLSYDSSTYRIVTTFTDMLISASRTVEMLCDGYDCKYNGEIFDANWDMVIYNVLLNATSQGVYITNKSRNSVETFLASEGNKYIYYPLKTPVETDISQYLTDDDKYIDVEPLGTITFTNTYEQDVPSEITYLTEVAK